MNRTDVESLMSLLADIQSQVSSNTVKIANLNKKLVVVYKRLKELEAFK